MSMQDPTSPMSGTIERFDGPADHGWTPSTWITLTDGRIIFAPNTEVEHLAEGGEIEFKRYQLLAVPNDQR